MVILRLGSNGSGDSDAVFNFYCTTGKLNWCRIFRACRFGSRFLLIWSGRFRSCWRCSFQWVFEMTDCCCFWNMVLCQFGLSGLFALGQLMNCFNAQYIWAFLCQSGIVRMLPDKTLDSLASWCAWFGQSLRLGKPSNSPWGTEFPISTTRITCFNDDLIKLACVHYLKSRFGVHVHPADAVGCSTSIPADAVGNTSTVQYFQIWCLPSCPPESWLGMWKNQNNSKNN